MVLGLGGKTRPATCGPICPLVHRALAILNRQPGRSDSEIRDSSRLEIVRTYADEGTSGLNGCSPSGARNYAAVLLSVGFFGA
jgi:hypothetical protein